MPENNRPKVGDLLDPGLVESSGSSYTSDASNPGGGGRWFSDGSTTVTLNDGSTVVVDGDGTILAVH